MSRANTLKILLALLAASTVAAAQTTPKQSAAAKPAKPRIIVTTDPECDDSNSMIRFLLYSTDYQVEGLIYTSSEFHWKGDGKGTKWFIDGREYTRFAAIKGMCPCESWRWNPNEKFIDDRVDAYAKVYPNLKIHNPDYPAPAYLKSVIRYGNIYFDSEMERDTPGSDFIKAKILDNTPGTLYITAWGGTSTIARALKSIQDEYEKKPGWDALKAKITKKVVLLLSGEQDQTVAKYIRPNWPDMISGGGFSPVSPMGDRGAAAAEGGEDFSSAKWIKENILDQGALGAMWRTVGDGRGMVPGDKMDYLSLKDVNNYTDDQIKAMGYEMWTARRETGASLGEGDSGTFTGFLDFGLRGRSAGRRLGDTVSRGGFLAGSNLPGLQGGRDAAPGTPGAPQGVPGAQGARGAATPGGMPGGGFGAGRGGATGPNFSTMAWHDFAARLKWSVTPNYKDANHKPVVTLQGPKDFAVTPGQIVQLSATATDPDKDTLTFKWWQYKNVANTYAGDVTIADPAALKTSFQVPADAKSGDTNHVVAEATDNGTPTLTHYQDIIVTVK
jgi:hypothetical protein